MEVVNLYTTGEPPTPHLGEAKDLDKYCIKVTRSDSLLFTKILHRDIPARWLTDLRNGRVIRCCIQRQRRHQWSVFTYPIYGQKIVPHKSRRNWVAFFFTPIWHIATRASLVWKFILLPRDESLSLLQLSAAAVNIAVVSIWLFKANTFRQKSLEARGYKLVDTIEGRTKDEVRAKLKATS